MRIIEIHAGIEMSIRQGKDACSSGIAYHQRREYSVPENEITLRGAKKKKTWKTARAAEQRLSSACPFSLEKKV